MKQALTLAVVLILLPAILLLGQGGSLTPPGAPAPTMKTLDQIEPRIEINATNTPGDADSVFRISARGSYYLSGNLSVPAGKHGIEVGAAGHMTIDLNGFIVAGVNGSLDGIHAGTTFVNNVIIRNGHVTGFDGSGIKLTGVQHVIEQLIADDNGQDGIAVGEASVIRACIVNSNGTNGIVAAGGVIVTECSARENGGNGINAGSGSTLTNCTAFSNHGAYGIITGDGSTLTNCTAKDNTSTYGIIAGEGSTLIGCTAHSNNVAFGIRADDRSTLTNCTSTLNTSAAADSWGISAGAQCTISQCSVNGNLNTNGTPSDSTGGGILAGGSSTVQHCTVVGNKGDGIQIASDARVVGNNCDSNSFGGGDAAGIHATGADNRIEGNNVTDNTRGIDVDSSGSLIIKNSASGNTTNYEIAASNAVGVIVSAPASVAISGSTGGAGVGSTDPWANFSY